MTDAAPVGPFSPRLRKAKVWRTPAWVALSAASSGASDAQRPGGGRDLTLLDVIEAIQESTTDDAESTAILRALLRCGAVRRRGPRR